MFENYKFTAAERFLRYVQIDTQSDPLSKSNPSTEKQKDLSKILAEELKQLGVADAHMDEWGYVYGTIPSNTEKKVPVICFCAHVDTAPDCSGKDVKPIVHTNYQGHDIILPDDTTQVLKLSEYPYLQTQIGNDIITASGCAISDIPLVDGTGLSFESVNSNTTVTVDADKEIVIIHTI